MSLLELYYKNIWNVESYFPLVNSPWQIYISNKNKQKEK